MERLPREVLDAVLAGLTGFELVRLSHVNSRFSKLLAADQRWKRYFPLQTFGRMKQTPNFWRLRYMRARSLRLNGQPTGPECDDEGDKSGQFVPVHNTPGRQCMWRPASSFTEDFGPGQGYRSVAIDTWFALLPRDEHAHSGGVLFGAQSAYPGSSSPSHYHEQFIIIDSRRNLFASLLDHDDRKREPVATSLSECRWYHLALVFDGSTRIEQVFLDGQLVATQSGDWHRDWDHLDCSQVGTGYVSAGNNMFPVAGHVGWFGFRGIVDEFRVWRRALSAKDVQRLAAGSAAPESNSVWFALSIGIGLNLMTLRLKLVQCTRPNELQCVVAARKQQKVPVMDLTP